MSYGKPLLGEIFQKEFGLTAGQLQVALDRQKSKGGLFGESLVALGYDPEEKVQEALSIQLDLPWWPAIDPDLVDEALLAKVPISFAKRFRLLPTEKRDLFLWCLPGYSWLLPLVPHLRPDDPRYR